MGTEAIELLAGEDKPVILEIDQPVDEISRRRQAFYKRAGFATNSHAHVHPLYCPENPGHALVVMARPHPLTDGEYALSPHIFPML